VTIKNYFSKPNTWAKRGAAAAILVGATALLGSCGGSGVSSETGVQVGALSLLPGTGTIYANVPFNFTIAGGRKPYFITTNEQSLIPLNYTLNSNSFTVVANNPGVVDVGQDPKEVPSRSIRFTIRDNAGTELITGDKSFSVLQNFVTGYNLSIASLFSCGVTSTGTAVPAEGCAGGESVIDLRPTFSGVLYQNRALKFSINYGEFIFIDKNSNPPNNLVPTITLTTSGATAPGGTEGGSLRAFFRSSNTARTQFAGMRITDVLTGLYRDVDFLIVNPTITTKPTLIPAVLGPLAGADSSKCGAGGVDVRISAGVPPYSIAVSPSSRAIVTVSPLLVSDANGIFTVSATSAPASSGCLNEPNAVTVTDSLGQSASFAVNTTVGTGTPVQPLSVVPNAPVCLLNTVGSSTQVAIFGGNATKAVISRDVTVATAISATTTTGTGTTATTTTSPTYTITNTRPLPTPPTVPATTTLGSTTIDISDGASTLSLAVKVAATCP
jgi:hypothetical protein